MEKIATNVKKLTKNSQKFDEKIEIRKRCKGVHCVDLGESFPTHIYLQNFDRKIEIRKRGKGVHCVDLGESFPTSI